MVVMESYHTPVNKSTKRTMGDNSQVKLVCVLEWEDHKILLLKTTTEDHEKGLNQNNEGYSNTENAR